MNFKKFTIYATIISLIIIIATFSLGFITTSTPLHIDEPSAFYIYNNDTTSTKITKENNPEVFQQLVNGLNNLTNINLATRLIQGGNINEQPSQDVKSEYGEITVNLIKIKHVVVEVVWENKQQQIVYINGNTKMLEFYSMAFAIEDTSTRIIPICLSQSLPNVTNKDYKGSPLLIRGSTAELYKATKEIIEN